MSVYLICSECVFNELMPALPLGTIIHADEEGAVLLSWALRCFAFLRWTHWLHLCDVVPSQLPHLRHYCVYTKILKLSLPVLLGHHSFFTRCFAGHVPCSLFRPNAVACLRGHLRE